MSQDGGPSELAPIAQAIKELSAEMRKDGPKKLYVIYTEPYTRGAGGEQPMMSQFHGTYRELLEFLYNGDVEDWEEETKVMVAAQSDEDLFKLVDEANGDGGAFQAVWCVDDRKAILGAINVED